MVASSGVEFEQVFLGLGIPELAGAFETLLILFAGRFNRTRTDRFPVLGLGRIIQMLTMRLKVLRVTGNN